MWTANKGALGSGLLLCALYAFSGSAAAQARPPNEAELRSTYCVEVLRAEIALQSHLVSASSEAAGTTQPQLRDQWIETSNVLLQQLARLEGALRRLQAYMLPRIRTIDPAALASVIRQASADAQAPPAGADAALGRVRDCENAPWLPGEAARDR